MSAPNEPEPVAHTVIVHDGQSASVQHFGPAHVVDGSERVVDLPAGYTLVIRHIAPEDQKPVREY